MQIKKGDIIKAKCIKTAFGGQGIVKHKFEDNREFVFFVDNMVEGDIANIKLLKIKKNHGEAKIEELLVPSKLRVQSACPHFNPLKTQSCGGCKWQNIPYENQLGWKQKQVEETLKHIGGFQDLKVSQIIKSENKFFYRNKMEFSIGDTVDREFALGLHVPARRYDLIDIKECFLQSKFSNLILNKIKLFIKKQNYINLDNFESLVIRNSIYNHTYLINLVFSAEVNNIEFNQEFISLVESINNNFNTEKIDSVYITNIIRQRGTPTRQKSKHLYGEKHIWENLYINNLKYSFKVGPFSFFQPNTMQAEKIYNKAIELSNPKTSDVLFDLYCGTGTIGICFASKVKKVYGIEINQEAILAARDNAKFNNINNIEFFKGDTFENLNKLGNANIIIVDPPRAGLGEKVCGHLLKILPEKIVYISCNPATQARDLKLLSENYKIKEVQPVDQFPHTYHIENIVLLEKE